MAYDESTSSAIQYSPMGACSYGSIITHLYLGQICLLLRCFGDQSVPPGLFLIYRLDDLYAQILLMLEALQHALVGILASFLELLWSAAHELLLRYQPNILIAEFRPAHRQLPQSIDSIVGICSACVHACNLLACCLYNNVLKQYMYRLPDLTARHKMQLSMTSPQTYYVNGLHAQTHEGSP